MVKFKMNKVLLKLLFLLLIFTNNIFAKPLPQDQDQVMFLLTY